MYFFLDRAKDMLDFALTCLETKILDSTPIAWR